MPDTVSTVCRPYDGVTKCGARTLSVFDKDSGTDISNQIYKGFKLNGT